MQWYYVKDGQRVGPLVNADFLMRVKQGDITDDTLVWNGTMDAWKAYRDVPDAIGASLAAAMDADSETCSICGKRCEIDETIEFEGKMVCSGCKSTFVQQIRENAEIAGKTIMRYAGFWRRLLAYAIDIIVQMAVVFPISFIMGLMGPLMANHPAVAVAWTIIMQLVIMAFAPFYFIWMHGKYGATLGKKALGIKVVMSDGRKITYGRATGRFFAHILSRAILAIGCIMAGFDEQKRALHDHMCDTRVIFT